MQPRMNEWPRDAHRIYPPTFMRYFSSNLQCLAPLGLSLYVYMTSWLSSLSVDCRNSREGRRSVYSTIWWTIEYKYWLTSSRVEATFSFQDEIVSFGFLIDITY